MVFPPSPVKVQIMVAYPYVIDRSVRLEFNDTHRDRIGMDKDPRAIVKVRHKPIAPVKAIPIPIIEVNTCNLRHCIDIFMATVYI